MYRAYFNGSRAVIPLRLGRHSNNSVIHNVICKHCDVRCEQACCTLLPHQHNTLGRVAVMVAVLHVLMIALLLMIGSFEDDYHLYYDDRANPATPTRLCYMSMPRRVAPLLDP